MKRKIKKVVRKVKVRKRCKNCYKLKADVMLCADPYEEDVNNTTVLVLLCKKCVKALAREI